MCGCTCRGRNAGRYKRLRQRTFHFSMHLRRREMADQKREREGKKESHSHPRHGQTAPAFRISRTLRLFLCCGIAFIVENSNSLLGSVYFAFELAALLFCFCHSACKPRESGSAIGHQVEKQTHTTAGERWRERPRSPHAKRSPCKKLLDTKMHFLKTIPRLSSSEYSSTFNS